MGDILHALPAVTALRLAHPAWEIDWIVEPRWQALLATGQSTGRGPEQPIVDRVHLAPTKEWRHHPLALKTTHEIKALRDNLKAVPYNAVIDLQGSLRSAVLGRMAGCQRLIGEETPREAPARLLYTERIATHGAHVIEQDIELASAIAGDLLTPTPPLLPVDPAAESWCEALLASSGTRPLALINPGAGWGAKCWPVERYAEVACGLSGRGFRVLVNAGPAEEQMADVIVKGTSGAAIPLATSLQQLIALTRRAALFVAGDTGPLHLACALGRPVVGIYGPTDPSRNGPFGTKFRVLRSPLSKRDHARHPQPEAGLLTIEPEEVMRAIDDLLAEVDAQ
jgi:heptosyltransferase-1